MKSYNPYTGKIASLSSRIASIQATARELKSTIEWCDSTSLQEMIASKEDLDNRIAVARKKVHLITIKIVNQRNDYERRESNAPSIFNPFSWFDAEASLERKALERMRIELTALEKVKGELGGTLSELSSRHADLDRDVAEYKDIDYAATKQLLEEKEALYRRLGNELADLKAKRDEADKQLRPLENQLRMKIKERAEMNNLLASAERFEEQLSNAADGRERRGIHEACAEKHGVDKPRLLMNQCRRAIPALSRDIEKLEKRLSEIAGRLARTYTAIVVDGNNLCYEGNRFVGLGPVLKAMDAIKIDADKIVVFDSDIRALLSCDSEAIKKQFPDGVKVHVAPTKQKADETIIELASRDAGAYILSNDRFAEYPDKEAVKGNRIVRHEVFDGSLMIHDLDVNVTYR